MLRLPRDAYVANDFPQGISGELSLRRIGCEQHERDKHADRQQDRRSAKKCEENNGTASFSVTVLSWAHLKIYFPIDCALKPSKSLVWVVEPVPIFGSARFG